MNRQENILETIQMIAEDKLDIRTVTMGISLLDCADLTVKKHVRKSIIKSRHTPKD